MSLNVAEASAVNTLVSHLLGTKPRSRREPPTRKEAIEAIAMLADSAHKRLASGHSGDSVRETLPVLWRSSDHPFPPLAYWLDDGQESPVPDLYSSRGIAKHAADEQWKADNPFAAVTTHEWLDAEEDGSEPDLPADTELVVNGERTGLIVRVLRPKTLASTEPKDGV